jgi:hypothetical protein
VTPAACPGEAPASYERLAYEHGCPLWLSCTLRGISLCSPEALLKGTWLAVRGALGLPCEALPFFVSCGSPRGLDCSCL